MDAFIRNAFQCSPPTAFISQHTSSRTERPANPCIAPCVLPNVHTGIPSNNTLLSCTFGSATWAPAALGLGSSRTLNTAATLPHADACLRELAAQSHHSTRRCRYEQRKKSACHACAPFRRQQSNGQGLACANEASCRVLAASRHGRLFLQTFSRVKSRVKSRVTLVQLTHVKSALPRHKTRQK